MLERLQKILAHAGVASRRAAEQLISEGRVSVNGAIVSELGTRADAGSDEIRVDGTRLRLAPEKVYLLLNKPRGVVCTRSDPGRRRTVMDLVPAVAGLFPVGRLDVSTEGLILLTNDGAFAERVAHPRYEVSRVYLAKVRGVPDASVLERLRRGIRVDRERLAVDKAVVVSAEGNAWLELTLHEGKHHEMRRLLLAAGHPVSKLRRVAIGPLTERGLAVGAFRPLSPAEVRALLTGLAPNRGSRSAGLTRPPHARARVPARKRSASPRRMTRR